MKSLERLILKFDILKICDNIFFSQDNMQKPKWKWKSNMQWLYIYIYICYYPQVWKYWPLFLHHTSMDPWSKYDLYIIICKLYITVGPNCEKKSHLGSFNTNYIIFRNVKIFKKYFFPIKKKKKKVVKEIKTIFKNTLEIF